jgi:hypothetical protein
VSHGRVDGEADRLDVNQSVQCTTALMSSDSGRDGMVGA